MATTQRLPAVDALRGLAILLMIAYHFSYDLDHFGLAQFDFSGKYFWLASRNFIVSLFLLTVGISLTLATSAGFRPRPFFRRLGLLVLFAALVTLASYWMFPNRYIFFGILHFIAVASVLGLFFLRFYWLNLILGVLLLVLGFSYQHPFFNQPLLQWVGLMTYKPPTEDYVPLLPWFGLVLIGIFAGKYFFQRQHLPALNHWKPGHPFTRLLALSGRHSLSIYMLHQPLLMGLLWTMLALFGAVKS